MSRSALLTKLRAAQVEAEADLTVVRARYRQADVQVVDSALKLEYSLAEAKLTLIKQQITLVGSSDERSLNPLTESCEVSQNAVGLVRMLCEVLVHGAQI